MCLWFHQFSDTLKAHHELWQWTLPQLWKHLVSFTESFSACHAWSGFCAPSWPELGFSGPWFTITRFHLGGGKRNSKVLPNNVVSMAACWHFIRLPHNWFYQPIVSRHLDCFPVLHFYDPSCQEHPRPWGLHIHLESFEGSSLSVILDRFWLWGTNGLNMFVYF